MLRTTLILVAFAGCVETGVTECPGGLVCAAGTSCVQLVAGGYACASKDEAICGDGVVMAPEGCEPSLAAACTASCTRIVCGDGTRDVGEACDDLNTIPHDGCDNACQSEQPEVVLDAVDRPDIGRNAAGVFDARRGVAVIFGGFGVSVPGATVWELDAQGRWRDVEVAVTPPGRAEHAMAYDPELGRVVMFGGRLRDKIGRDLWLWDGVEWSFRADAGPSPRAGHAMAYDAITKQSVMYGGVDLVGDLFDAWAWSDSGWVAIDPPATNLREPVMAFDAASGRLVLVGIDAGGARRTITRSGSTWTTEPWPITESLTEYELVTDPAHGGMLLVGNTTGIASTTLSTFRLAPTGWEPVANADETMRVDFTAVGTTTGAVMLGGPLDTMPPMPGATLFWDGATWVDDVDPRLLDFTTSPGGNVASDLTHQRLLGFTVDTTRKILEVEGERVRVAEITGDLLIDLDPYRLAYDETSGTLVVLTGGSSGVTPIDTYVGTRTVSGSTVTWDFDAVSTTGPTEIGSAVYDVANQRVVTVAVDRAGVFKTWAFDGSAWSEVPSAEHPVRRYNYSLAYDRKRQTIVLFGGGTTESTVDLLDDTWILDAAGWRRLTAPGPTPRGLAGLAYDMDRQRVVLIGGINGSESGLGDAWELDWQLDRAQWRRHDTVVVPTGAVALSDNFVTSPDGVGVTTVGSFFPGRPVRLRLLWTSTSRTEACQRLDSDGDGLVGCADEACWHVCSPLCRPGDEMCAPGPRCGDGMRDALEQCGVCEDAGACNTCGDLVCDAGESCPGDCP